MFNGIIKKTGLIKYIKKEKENYYIGIESSLNFSGHDLGSSVSCNGVCLTITKIKNKTIFFYISKETLNRSNLKLLNLGDLINLEKSISYGQKISGHFVQGHVDTTALIRNISIQNKVWLVNFYIKDRNLSNYLVEKASISINRVSLTISKVKKQLFEISIIPHTLKLTNLKNLKIKSIVNIELDIFVKYIIKVSK